MTTFVSPGVSLWTGCNWFEPKSDMLTSQLCTCVVPSPHPCCFSQAYRMQNSSLQTTLPPNAPQCLVPKHLQPQRPPTPCPPTPCPPRLQKTGTTIPKQLQMKLLSRGATVAVVSAAFMYADEGIVKRRNRCYCVCSIHVASVVHNLCCCVCSIHVASVVQMTHMLLVHGGVLKSKVMNRTQQLATYWSATVHDYEHGGLNNDFLIKTAHPLAITYNDSSPLENHHLAASSRVLYTPEYCFPPVSPLSSCIAVSKPCMYSV